MEKYGKTLWLCGLPCSGKTTLGDALKKKYLTNAIRLDGDHVREGLCSGLGFSDEGRMENIRRCAEIAEILNNQGFDVICTFITPQYSHHKLLRSLITRIKLIHIDTPVKICEERDIKGMWAKAKQGKIKGFTGYDSCFEIPNADLRIDTTQSIEKCVKEIFKIYEG